MAATIPRELLAATLPVMDSRLIKVITGPRRAGKSVFAFQLLQGQEFGYVNFDDERLARLPCCATAPPNRICSVWNNYLKTAGRGKRP